MKITIDISQTAFKGAGVARYMTHMVEALSKYGGDHEYKLLFCSLRQHVPESIRRCLHDKMELQTLPFPPSVLEVLHNRIHKLPAELFSGKTDIFYTSDWTEPPTRSAKKITTIHDLIPFTHPDTLQHTTDVQLAGMQIKSNIVATHKRRLEWVKKESSLIFCDSQATLDDAERILDIPRERMRVLYPATKFIEPSQDVLEKTKKKYNITKKFILTVGTLQPRKNIGRLIEAFEKINDPDLELFIVGMKGWGEQVVTTNPRVHLLGLVSDEELFALYKLAFIFAMPSLYEGFGYPVAEAMAMGCPVATSNTSSLKELGEGRAELFDPLDVNSIAEALSSLAKDEQRRKRLRDAGKEFAQTFTLKNFASQWLAAVEQL